MVMGFATVSQTTWPKTNLILCNSSLLKVVKDGVQSGPLSQHTLLVLRM
jgi:hypothetical protein